MKKGISEKELFETIPVPRAVATLAIPTIISQGLLNIPLLILMDITIGLCRGIRKSVIKIYT